MRAPRRQVIGPAISPRNTCASTRATGRSNITAEKCPPRKAASTTARVLSFPLPAGELFAEGDLFKLAYAGSWDLIHKHKGIRHLPTGERLSQKFTQFLFRGAGAFAQDHG